MYLHNLSRLSNAIFYKKRIRADQVDFAHTRGGRIFKDLEKAKNIIKRTRVQNELQRAIEIQSKSLLS